MLLLPLKNNNHQGEHKLQNRGNNMDPNILEQQNIVTRSPTQPIVKRSQLLKKMTPLLVSVSLLFSILLSHFSYTSRLSSLSLYFHSFRDSKLFTYTMDKNSMFLLCNGLLVFLAKFSRFMGAGTPTSSSNYTYDNGASIENYMEPSTEFEAHHPSPIFKPEEEPIILEKQVLVESAPIYDEAPQGLIEADGDQVEYETRELVPIENVQEKGGGGEEEIESGFLIIGKEGNCIEAESFLEEENRDIYREEEEEIVVDENVPFFEGVEEANAVLSTEELNKKFDEFIRKMKEGIRFEAQQRLVLVK